jgi:hypothetical protein
MALNKAEIDKLKKQLDELNKVYSKIGEKPITIDIGKATIDDLKLVNEYLSDAKVQLDDLDGGFSGIARSIKNIVDEWKPGFADPTKDATKSFTKLKGIAEKLSDDITNITVLNKKQLSQSYEQIKSEQKRLNTLKEELKNKKELSTAEEALLANLESEYDVTNDLLKQTKKRLDTEKQIEKTLGVTGAGFKALEKTLGKIGIESEHFSEMNESLREAAKSGNSFSVVGAGIKGVFKGVGSALKDPVVALTLAAKSFKTMYEIGVHFSKETAEISRDLGVSSDTAGHMVHHMEDMAKNSGDTLANTKNNLTSFKELNDYFGTSVEFSQKQLLTQTKLKEQAGLTTGEAAKLAEYEQLTGKSAESLYNSIGKTNKGVLSQKKITQEVLKTSGQLSAQYKNNPDLLAKAVTQAQRLGMTLEQTKKISSGLLNFEDSISAELEAELLTGQDLNLEKARYLALQGDSAGAAEEMMKNLGPDGLQKFQKMNNIQQEAYAKALGMSADELADSLVKQDTLLKLEKEGNKGIIEKVKALQKAGKTEEAAELQRRVAQGESVELAGQRLDAEKRILNVIDKAKDSLTSTAAGPLAKITEGVATAMESIMKIPNIGKILGVIGGLASAAALVGGVYLLYKTVGNFIKSATGKGPANQTAENTKRTADAVEKMANSGGSGTSKSVSSAAQERYTRRYGDKAASKRFGKKGGKFGKILGGLGSAMGMASMFGGGGEGEEAGGAMEGMADVADVASSGGGGGGATKAASTAGKAAKGGGLFGKIGGFFGGIGKKVMGGLGSVKKIFSGPLAKGFGKALGPILSIVESVGSAASLISDARERKTAGEKIDVGSLGKSLVQAAAYPIVNASMNLIPGFGTAISIGDGILSSFGLSPIKWITDNLIDLVPNDAFSGLGNLAVGEKAMAKGGIVTSPTRALVGEAGNEAVIPLTQFYAKLDELIAVVKQGGYVYLDGNKVGTAMAMGTFKTQ